MRVCVSKIWKSHYEEIDEGERFLAVHLGGVAWYDQLEERAGPAYFPTDLITFFTEISLSRPGKAQPFCRGGGQHVSLYR